MQEIGIFCYIYENRQLERRPGAGIDAEENYSQGIICEDMISRQEIQQFIDEDQAQVKREMDAFRRLSIEEKVKERKAIVGLRYDREYSGSIHDYALCRLIVDSNQSSLGVGDSIYVNGYEAVLWDFDNEGNLIVGFWGRAGVPMHCFPGGEDVVVEKQYGNFLAPSYHRFLSDLPEENDSFWNEGVIPSKRNVVYDGDVEKWKENIRAVEEELGKTLLDTQREAVARALASRDYYMLQGPPGTGKSFVIALIAVVLAFKFGQRVCIAGPNYMAINNALVKIGELVPQRVSSLAKVGYPYQTTGLSFSAGGDSYTIQNIPGHLDVHRANEMKGVVMGMTPYTFYSSRAAGIKFDTVIIDESGQMSVPVAMMAAINCDKVIFCGDHKQLRPIIRIEEIAESLRQSVFSYMLDRDNCTMIDVSFRMNGPICRVVSDLFYEGKLKSFNPDKRLTADIDDDFLSGRTPVVARHVDGNGRQSSSDEADEVDRIIRSYSNAGVEGGKIGVLAPFRAQCSEIRRKLYKDAGIPDGYKKDVIIDTIDKLQGQERDVVILSLTSGSIDYINELSEFLYNPNKLNVALSRAKTKLIILGNFDAIAEMDGYEGSYIQRLLDHPEVALVRK